MPTPIAFLRASGTAFITASRKPTMTSSVTTRPSQTITPIAPAGDRPCAGERERHDGVDPQPGGERERVVAHEPHGDREDAGDERRAGGQGDRP